MYKYKFIFNHIKCKYLSETVVKRSASKLRCTLKYTINKLIICGKNATNSI